MFMHNHIWKANMCVVDLSNTRQIHCWGAVTNEKKFIFMAIIREHGRMSPYVDGQKTKWRLQCKY